jgi:6-phosphogluconate dehydrogenase
MGSMFTLYRKAGSSQDGMEGSSDVGIFGLGPMGENFALNLLSRGFSVSVYNRTPERTRAFLERIGLGFAKLSVVR